MRTALWSPKGARYPLLVLGGSTRFMTFATLHRIRDLVDHGAAVVGSQPVGSPSLGDEKEAFEALADSLRQRPQGEGRPGWSHGRRHPRPTSSTFQESAFIAAVSRFPRHGWPVANDCFSIWAKFATSPQLGSMARTSARPGRNRIGWMSRRHCARVHRARRRYAR